MGYAKVAGMDTDLQISVGARYSICLIVFFPAYMLFEIPSNMSLVRFGVWKTLTFLISAWGILVMCMGFVNNWVCPIIYLRLIKGSLSGAPISFGCIRRRNHARNSVHHQFLVSSL
jgi:hypothetical protein